MIGHDEATGLPSKETLAIARDVEDLGFVPSFADCARAIPPAPWMGRAQPLHKRVGPDASAEGGMPGTRLPRQAT